MFKIAKSKQIENEKVIIKSLDNDSLNINLKGKLNDENYELNLIIEKDLKKHEQIPLYDKIKIDSADTIGSELFIKSNNNTFVCNITVEGVIMRYKDKYIYDISFRDIDKIYYGNFELEITIDKLKEIML